jgi:hypothetical protein
LVSIAEYKRMAKVSKYRSKKVKYVENGQEKTKDSVKEYRRGFYLKELEREGKISNLQEQVPFLLQEKIVDEKRRVVERAIKIILDFTYDENGEKIAEDVKSWITKRNPTYILKRKMFKKLYPQYVFREVA